MHMEEFGSTLSNRFASSGCLPTLAYQPTPFPFRSAPLAVGLHAQVSLLRHVSEHPQFIGTTKQTLCNSACLPPVARQASESESGANSAVPVSTITGALVCRRSRIYVRPHSASFEIHSISFAERSLARFKVEKTRMAPGNRDANRFIRSTSSCWKASVIERLSSAFSPLKLFASPNINSGP
jgi:hypothetical protein